MRQLSINSLELSLQTLFNFIQIPAIIIRKKEETKIIERVVRIIMIKNDDLNINFSVKEKKKFKNIWYDTFKGCID